MESNLNETAEQRETRLERLHAALEDFYELARSEEGAFSQEYVEEKLANAIDTPPERTRRSANEHRAPRKKGRSKRGSR